MKYISSLNFAAVIFFFLVSGFSISLSLKGEIQITSALINNYLYRRFRRIIPMYLTALVLTALCGLINGQIWFNQSYDIKNLLGNIFFLQCSNAYIGNWVQPYGNNSPLWSLSFEMWYYIFLPALLLLLNKLFVNQNLKNNTIHVGLLVSWVASIFSIWLNKQIFLPWIAFLTLFILWYLGYWLGVIYLTKKLSINHFFFLCFMTLIHFLLSTFIASSTLKTLLLGLEISTSLVFIYLLKNQFQHIFSLGENLINQIFNKSGQFSYSLYLYHFPLLLLCKTLYPDSRIALSATILVVFVLSYVAEKWFKKQKFSVFRREYLPG